jgi:hypothetical protein
VRRTLTTLLCLGLVTTLITFVGCQSGSEADPSAASSSSASSSPGADPSAGSAAPSPSPSAEDDSPVRQQLIGSWGGAFELSDSAPVDLFDEVTINICKSIRMQIVFHADNRLEMSASMELPEIGAQTTETSGEWKILGQEGNQIRVQAVDPEGAPEEVTIVLLDNDTFTMTPPNELRDLGTLRFQRQ